MLGAGFTQKPLNESETLWLGPWPPVQTACFQRPFLDLPVWSGPVIFHLLLWVHLVPDLSLPDILLWLSLFPMAASLPWSVGSTNLSCLVRLRHQAQGQSQGARPGSDPGPRPVEQTRQTTRGRKDGIGKWNLEACSSDRWASGANHSDGKPAQCVLQTGTRQRIRDCVGPHNLGTPFPPGSP